MLIPRNMKLKDYFRNKVFCQSILQTHSVHNTHHFLILDHWTLLFRLISLLSTWSAWWHITLSESPHAWRGRRRECGLTRDQIVIKYDARLQGLGNMMSNWAATSISGGNLQAFCWVRACSSIYVNSVTLICIDETDKKWHNMININVSCVTSVIFRLLSVKITTNSSSSWDYHWH